MSQPDPWAHLRVALQYLLDTVDGEGWVLSDYVVVVGLRRMNGMVVESSAWPISHPEQPDYVTDGLIAAAEDMRARCGYITDDD